MRVYEEYSKDLLISGFGKINERESFNTVLEDIWEGNEAGSTEADATKSEVGRLIVPKVIVRLA